MDCKRCKHWSQPYGFCRIEVKEPKPTGLPKTCPHFKKREA